MVNTSGLESNSKIPDLSWKVVTKGRRTRKPNSRNLNRGINLVNRSPKRVVDFSLSDSDKVSFLSLRFDCSFHKRSLI